MQKYPSPVTDALRNILPITWNAIVLYFAKKSNNSCKPGKKIERTIILTKRGIKCYVKSINNIFAKFLFVIHFAHCDTYEEFIACNDCEANKINLLFKSIELIVFDINKFLTKSRVHKRLFNSIASGAT